MIYCYDTPQPWSSPLANTLSRFRWPRRISTILRTLFRFGMHNSQSHVFSHFSILPYDSLRSHICIILFLHTGQMHWLRLGTLHLFKVNHLFFTQMSPWTFIPFILRYQLSSETIHIFLIFHLLFFAYAHQHLVHWFSQAICLVTRWKGCSSRWELFSI